MLSLVLLAAGAPVLDLSWSAPCAGRPDAQEFRLSAPSSASVTIAPQGSRWSLDVELVQPRAGRRTLTVESCAAAVKAAVLLLHLALEGGTLDADATSRNAKPPPSPVREPPRLEVSAVSAPPTSPPPELTLSVLGAVLTGTQPSPTPRLIVQGTVQWQWVVADLALRAGVPASWQGGPIDTARFNIHPALGAQLRTCAAWRRSVFSLGGCAAGGVEWLRWSGAGVSNPATASSLDVHVGLDARVAVALAERFLLLATGGARYGLTRGAPSFTGGDVVFVPAAISGVFELGVGFRL